MNYKDMDISQLQALADNGDTMAAQELDRRGATSSGGGNGGIIGGMVFVFILGLVWPLYANASTAMRPLAFMLILMGFMWYFTRNKGCLFLIALVFAFAYLEQCGMQHGFIHNVVYDKNGHMVVIPNAGDPGYHAAPHPAHHETHHPSTPAK